VTALHILLNQASHQSPELQINPSGEPQLIYREPIPKRKEGAWKMQSFGSMTLIVLDLFGPIPSTSAVPGMGH
jgi:hypothetical protein